MSFALQPNYNLTQAVAYAGMPASMHGWDADTKIVETVAGIGFARAVSKGTEKERGIIIGGADFVGITYRDITLVHATPDLYARYDLAGVMNAGDLWVDVAAAVAPGDAVVFSATTGQFAVAGTTVLTARYVTGTTGAGLAIIRLNLPNAAVS